MSRLCEQCQKKPAIYNFAGHLLCLECYYKVEQLRQQELAGLLTELNYLTDSMEATVGLHGILPRYKVPEPIINKGPINVHNIRVDNSIVGSINTGKINNLNVAMENMTMNGQDQLAFCIKKFIEEVLKDDNIGDDEKNEIIEMADVIATQASKQPGKRLNSIIKMVSSRITQLLTTGSAAMTVWDHIKPYIEQLIQ